MFNDTIGKFMYGEAHDTVRKIKNIEENGGYSVYYRVEKSPVSNEEYVKYDLELVKNNLEKKIKSPIDRCFFNQLIKREYKLESLLRKYDYNKVAIVENAKCAVIFVSLAKEVIESVNEKPESFVGEMLDAFTCERESEVANGRYVSFTELVNFLKHITQTLEVDDEFFDEYMDYIMTAILKYNL